MGKWSAQPDEDTINIDITHCITVSMLCAVRSFGTLGWHATHCGVTWFTSDQRSSPQRPIQEDPHNPFTRCSFNSLFCTAQKATLNLWPLTTHGDVTSSRYQAFHKISGLLSVTQNVDVTLSKFSGSHAWDPGNLCSVVQL